MTYCSGQNCPLKNDCLRYKKDLNKRVHPHLDFPPYDATKGKCERQLFLDGSNLNNSLDSYINSIIKNAKD